jgi:uncharacterized protein YjeT (DUF2065 family)
MISIFAIIISVVLILTGIYIIFFPISFRARIVKESNTCIRFIGFSVITLGIAFAAWDLKTQSMWDLMRTLDATFRDTKDVNSPRIDAGDPNGGELGS